MKTRSRVKNSIAAILIGVLVGGGLMAVTPAGAEVAQMAATNWKKIWKNELQPLADKRYYKKSKADKKFAFKKETYNKAETDAKYQLKGSYATAGSSYTKAESDGRYDRSTELVRGSYMILNVAAAAGAFDGTDISFGKTFSAAPVVHIIPFGTAPPVGCSGTVAAPDAAPGNLCVFGSLSVNAGPINSCKTSTAACFGTASDPWGASIFTTAIAAGSVQAFGTWAARPAAVVTTAFRSDSGSGGSIDRAAPLGTGAR